MAHPASVLPRPRRVEYGDRALVAEGPLLRGRCPDDDRLSAALDRACPHDAESGVHVHLELEPGRELEGAVRPEGYRLTVDGHGITVSAASAVALFRGLATVSQLAEDGSVRLSALRLEDWPAFDRRGYCLDVSRDRVPTMESLFALVDRLAAWKLNQLQLYTEHTFAYAGHEEVWRDASPLTPEEVRELDAYCRERFVELVPNQNTLAHFHRWLVHDRYRELAETPEGILHPFSRDPEPFSLCPTDPRTQELLADLFGQLLPCFESDLVNVGLDEPMDLGQGRSRETAERIGLTRLFADHLRVVAELAGRHGKRVAFWSDWVLENPDAVELIPPGAVPLVWGYEADHPFEEHCALLAERVERYWVCPGTSSWNSIAGRTSNALANLLRAARVGRANGAEGYLVTDWGDHGHWQPPCISFAGLAMGAAVSWNAEAPPTPAELATFLSAHAFHDAAGVLGRTALALGDAHRAARCATVNGSAPFFLLHFAREDLPHERLPGLDSTGLTATLDAIGAATLSLCQAQPAERRFVDELRFAADLLRVGCRLGVARLASGGPRALDVALGVRRELAADLRTLGERHRELWLATSRPGGLDDSAGRFDDLARYLETDEGPR